MCVYVCVCVEGGGGGGLPRSATGWSVVCDCPVSFPSSCLFYFKFLIFVDPLIPKQVNIIRQLPACIPRHIQELYRKICCNL